MERNIEFKNGNEKIKLLRKQLKMTQQEFQDSHFTRGYLGLLENGRRNITLQASRTIVKKFLAKASEQGIDLKLEEDYFSRSVQEDARRFCEENLKSNLSLEELEIIMDIAKRYNLDMIEAMVYKKRGDINFGENEYLEAYKNYFYSMDILRSNDISDEICYIYNRLGWCKSCLLDYEEAIVYFNKAIINSEIFKKDDILMYATYNLAICYTRTSKFNEAIEIIDEFIRKFNTEEYFLNYIYAKILKANSYEGLKDIENAILIFNSVIELVKERQDDESSKLLGLIYSNLGSIYTKKGELSKALDYYNQSQQIRMKVDKKNVAHTLIEKASIYIEKKLYDEAIMIIELGIERAKEYNDYEYIIRGYELLEKIYSNTGMKDDLEKIIKSVINFLENTGQKDSLIKYYIKMQELNFKNKEYDKAEKCLFKIQEIL